MNAPVIPGLNPPLPIGNIFCIGRNYSEHAREMQQQVPEQPMVFLKPSSSIVFDNGIIELPPQSNEVHHEVELVVALGKGGKNILESQALEHVAGYGIGIDVTARDIQQRAKERSHPWTVAKGFDTFAPISRFLPADKVPDPQSLYLKLNVNSEIRQSGHTKDMIFPVATLIAYLSTVFTLRPGDLIFTGTPEGVSAIKHGDVVRATLGDQLLNLTVTVNGS
jgi:2-keto-4-pentenoate hydratase/2-oxohepta-3-ene-1,7-dioic acid hydratase in catechol pathway